MRVLTLLALLALLAMVAHARPYRDMDSLKDSMRALRFQTDDGDLDAEFPGKGRSEFTLSRGFPGKGRGKKAKMMFRFANLTEIDETGDVVRFFPLHNLTDKDLVQVNKSKSLLRTHYA